MEEFFAFCIGSVVVLIGLIILVIYSIYNSFQKSKKKIEERKKKTIEDLNNTANSYKDNYIRNRYEAIYATTNILNNIIKYYNIEVLVIFLLDENNKCVNTKVIIGDTTKVTFSTDEIIAYSLENNAKKLIFAHNHPNNISTPSDIDVLTGAELLSKFEEHNLVLSDLIVCCHNEYKSVLDSIRFKKITKEY